MSKIHLKIENSIAVITLDSDRENSIDEIFIQEFQEAFQNIKQSDAKVVLIESAKTDFFCNGLNPDIFLYGSKESIRNIMKSLAILGWEHFFFPLPTISLISGYAAGGGAFLATFSDFRFMNKTKSRIGFTEIYLSMTIPSIALELLAIKIGYQNVVQTTIQGKLFKAEDCLKYQLVDEVFETYEETKKNAYKFAEQLSKFSLHSLVSIKKGYQRWISKEHLEIQLEKDLKEIEDILASEKTQEAFATLKEKRKK
ncbi:MAG: enoyl-CoA hydratase/isomerase family protein [Leptospiraceae bacterium]|nr:enoyl-CoA hydratase/isomerase family protein [Leptospiraceae bacterium]MDW7975535.1 enoyl-CoA hydratase/isomerase family protein [Leptospiraceae bacterium]